MVWKVLVLGLYASALYVPVLVSLAHDRRGMHTNDQSVLWQFLVEAFWGCSVEVEVDRLGGGEECAKGSQARNEGAHLGVSRRDEGVIGMYSKILGMWSGVWIDRR